MGGWHAARQQVQQMLPHSDVPEATIAVYLLMRWNSGCVGILINTQLPTDGATPHYPRLTTSQ